MRAAALLVTTLAALAPCAPASGQQAATDAATAWVVGHVTGRFQNEVRPLSFAMVEILSGSERLRAVTDGSGRYALGELPPGEVTLSVTHAGYEPLSLELAVPAGGSVGVDIELEARPVRLTPLEVRAGAGARRQGLGGTVAESMSELEMQVLEVGPGLGQAGIVDVVTALPGNDPGDATDVLFMRGSTTDMKLVLLDGVPVYTPFHVAGLLRSFEPTMLEQAELHVGGAPARFDGGLTHILELTTRTARRDAVHFSGSVDLLSGSAAVELPLGASAGLVASGRSLHDLASGPLGGERPYGYQDAMVSFDLEPGEGRELRATGFWNEESVALDLQPIQDEARWSNRAGSVAYRSDLGGPELEVTAGLSRYTAALPIQPSAEPGAPPAPALLATAQTDRARVVGEVLWGSPAAPLRTGLSFEHIGAAFAARALGLDDRARSRGSLATAGAFVDATRPLGPGVSLRAGLRVDHFFRRSTKLAPRASLSWSVGPEALLTITAGRYHQPTRTPEVDVEQTLADVTQGDVLPSELLPIATADHVILSLDQRLNASVRMGLQGFWKSFQGLPGEGLSNVRSSGVDVRVLSGSERRAAWLGYGLSWFWSRSDLSGRATDFAGRHLMSAGVSGDIGGPFRGEARVAFGAGLPYTSIPLGVDPGVTGGPTDISLTGVIEAEAHVGSLAESLDQSFLRIDAELYAVLEPRWGSREWRVRPYLRLLNALDRRDALFYAFERWRSDAVRPLAEMPILPLLGVSVSF